MAAAGHPVSELYSLGGAVSLESALFDTSKSCAPALTPSGLAEGAGYTSQEEPKEAFSEICKEQSTTPPTREANCSALQVSEDPAKQKQSCPQPLVETPCHHHHQIAVNAINDPQAGRTVESMKSSPLPVHRSHSGTLPLVKQEMPPLGPDRETCGLTCKQPMQLQPCNIITTIYRGATGGEGGGGVQQPLCRCFCVPEAKVEEVEKKDHLPSKCDDPLYYGSYIHHGNFEDTFAAYCHPQPIPAPSQVLPRPVESSWDMQRAGAPPLAMDHLTLPRLISSVSETGLDAKHLLRCCNVNCSWISTLPPAAGPQYQKHCGLEECCGSPVVHVKTRTQEVGTMTAPKELKDVGVQTGQTLTPHVFPQICLVEESNCESSYTQTYNTVSDRGKKSGGGPKSPVKEVKWDAEGMTWEVYGASVDPEELGLAIQKHLELQIKETASRAAKLSRQNTNNSRQSGNAGSQRKRSRMMGSIRTPACCARTTTAVD